MTSVVHVQTVREKPVYFEVARALIEHFGRTYQQRFVTVLKYGYEVRLPGVSLEDALYAAELYLIALPVKFGVYTEPTS